MSQAFMVQVTRLHPILASIHPDFLCFHSTVFPKQKKKHFLGAQNIQGVKLWMVGDTQNALFYYPKDVT